MADFPNEHDRLFDHMSKDLECVFAVICERMDPDLVEQFDRNRLPEPIDRKEIAASGRVSIADAVYRVYLKDGSYIIVIIEHKSWNDRSVLLQLARTKERVWSREIQQKRAQPGNLPPMFCLVVYHGKDTWTAPRNESEMERDIPGYSRPSGGVDSYILFAVREYPKETLSALPRLKSTLLAMALAADKAASQEDVDMIAEGIDTTELAIYLFGYVCSKLGVSRDELDRAVALNSPHGTEVEAKVNYIEMVARSEGVEEGLEEGLEKGREEGLEKGREEGRKEAREEFRQNQVRAFLQVARIKFDRVPKELEKQIRAAKPEQLDDWLSRLLTADDLASLIAAPAKG